MRYWFTCTDLCRDSGEQKVAFGPFNTKPEAWAFGRGLLYGELCKPDGPALLDFAVAFTPGLRVRLAVDLTKPPVDGLVQSPEFPENDPLAAYSIALAAGEVS